MLIGKPTNDDNSQDDVKNIKENSNEILDKDSNKEKQEIQNEALNDNTEVSTADSNKANDSKTLNDTSAKTFDINEFQLPYSENIEQKNLAAFKKRMELDADLDTLLCKKCTIFFTDANVLYRHMAEHFKWYRYGCKLCDFKHYILNELPEHIKVVHKLNGDYEFYSSTIKALDANEASNYSNEIFIDLMESTSTSPESRRPSRCSSDSSRYSDNDSCSSNSRVDTICNRKRKIFPTNSNSKRKRETPKKGRSTIAHLYTRIFY